jgi:hypothetical protein
MRIARSPRAFAAVLCCALSSPAGPVHAQNADPVEEARANFQRALELEQARDYAGALKLFRQVGQVKLTPQVRYHIAACEENLGKMVAALGGYELALKHGQGMPAGFLAEVQQSIDYLKQRIPTVIVSRGEGAQAAAIELDGVQLGSKSIGIEVPLDPGPHVLRATAPGYQDFQETINVSEGDREEVTIDLVLLPKAVAPPPPPPKVEPEAGPVKGYGALPFIVGGSGLVVAAVGGVLLGVSQGQASQAVDLCNNSTDCTGVDGDTWQEARSLYDSARTTEAIGWVGIGVGVTAVAVGTVLYVLDPGRKSEQARVRKSEQAGMRVVPAAPGASAGLSFVGRF